MSSHRNIIGTGAFLGLLLILLGVFWVLHNTGVIDFHIRVWWPLILIFFGLLHLFHYRRVFDFFGWFMMGLGTILLLSSNKIITRQEIWKYWPILLVIFGISIIFNPGKSGSNKHRSKILLIKGTCNESTESTTSIENRIDEAIVFGSISKQITAVSFTGGSISIVFGGAEVDLRTAQLSEEGASLDVSTIFGGVEIRVPESWVIQIRSTAILGGVVTKFSNIENNTGKRLIINTSALLGGVEITN